MATNDLKTVDRYLSQRESLQTRNNVMRLGNFDLTNTEFDTQWARMSKDSRRPLQYHDYFFTGEDMRVHMAELGSDPEFGDMNLVGLMFQIEQQKAPVYGFWSRTYDAIMRGTRLVTGSLTLMTKDPDFVKRMLAKAASNRSERRGNLEDDFTQTQGWKEDQRNIERYWSQTLDESARLQGGSVFSSHPPFSLVMTFGHQDMSYQTGQGPGAFSTFEGDDHLYADTNHRLVEADQERSKVVIEGCEIQAMQSGVMPDQMMIEQYQFIARDVIVPTGSDVYNVGHTSSSSSEWYNTPRSYGM